MYGPSEVMLPTHYLLIDLNIYANVAIFRCTRLNAVLYFSSKIHAIQTFIANLVVSFNSYA